MTAVRNPKRFLWTLRGSYYYLLAAISLAALLAIFGAVL